MSRVSRALAVSLLGLAIAAPSLAADKDPVVANVNGTELHLSEVLRTKLATPQLAQMPMQMVYPMVLDNLINEQLLSEAGRKEGLARDPEIQAAMKSAETRFIAQAYAVRSARNAVTDQMVQTRYDEAKKRYKPEEEVRARHILVASRDAANAILAELKKGRKFEELAAEKSKDPGAQNGGDLGFFRKDEMVGEFTEAAFKLKPGQVSDPVKTKFGWHIIKAEEKRMSKMPEFDLVKEELKAQLAQEALGNIIRGLADKAQISRFDPEGKPLAPPAAPPAK